MKYDFPVFLKSVLQNQHQILFVNLGIYNKWLALNDIIGESRSKAKGALGERRSKGHVPALFKKRLTLVSYRSNLYLFILIKTFLLNLLSGGTIFDKAILSWGEF